MKKALIITNIPTPYRIPLFNELARQLHDRGWRLKVAFGAKGYPRRKWQIDMNDCRFDHCFLKTGSIGRLTGENVVFTYGGLYRLLDEERPDAIVGNGFSPATIKLWLRDLFRPTPYMIWSGAIATRFLPVSFLRRMQRRILVGRACGFIAYGTMAKEYLVSLGARASRVVIGINSVDTSFYSQAADRCRGSDRTYRHGRFVYVGHLTKGKRLDQLFQAVAALAGERSGFSLTVVGDGPERKALEALANSLNISKLISFEGFRQKEDIPQYLADSFCFMFPSEYDVWGLVLVEAMASQLPCISSIFSGATRDLVQHGETGFAIDFSDTATVVKHMTWFLDHPDEAERMGREARRFIEERCTVEVSARGFADAICMSQDA